MRRGAIVAGEFHAPAPEPPAELLLATATISAYRFRGRPRDPEDGRHRAVVVFAEPTMTPHRLAMLLRDAADRLELLPPT